MNTRRNFIFGSFFAAVAGMAQPKEQPSKMSMEAELEKVYGGAAHGGKTRSLPKDTPILVRKGESLFTPEQWKELKAAFGKTEIVNVVDPAGISNLLQRHKHTINKILP